MSNPVRDVIKQKILSAKNARSVEREPTPVVEEKGLFNTHSAVADDRVEYADIIGESHPSGQKYYFTVHKQEDWPEEMRPLIPAADDNHVFDHDYALSILMGIQYDKTAFAYGPAGSGKSVTPEQICARINYPFMFISGMGGTEPSDYIGSPWVTDGNMEWKDGIASFAVRNGAYLLYDEPFKSSAQTNMCFQSLMDTRKQLKLYGHPDPLEGSLTAHPKFRMLLADNVRGTGDQMDKYCAEVQDQSTLNRTAYKVQVNYLPAEREVQILKKKFPQATDRLCGKVVQLANLLRKGWDKGEIELPFSVRDTQQLVETAMIHNSVARAFTQTYYGAVKDEDERKCINDHWTIVGFDGEKL